MSQVFKEFADANLHRVYPLIDSAGGVDTTGIFTLPTSLISDIYLCAPNIPEVDVEKFYIQNILVRQFFIDITIGYDDSAVTAPIGTFKNISTTANLHSTYSFVPSEIQSTDVFTPLYHMTGQIIIGDPTDTIRSLGSWSFDPDETYITPTRVARGLLNVQYISINNRLFTGNVKLREGANISMDVVTQTVDGETETTITINASLNAGAGLQLSSDQDVLDALIDQYGFPLQSINGILPAADRNFDVFGEDCTTVEPAANGIVLSNPCATPCCDEDANIESILDSIANLNLRYSQLKAFFDATAASINTQQSKLLSLSAEV